MENYDKLKSIIQAANPEIMELKFGCEVNLDAGESYGLGYITSEISICPKHKRWSTCENNGECFDEHENGVLVLTGNEDGFWDRKVKTSDIKDYQILGRPIRLADVLLAYQKNGIIFTDKIVWKWNLKDDNLDHQSEECKQFLIDLIVTGSQ